MTHDFYIGKDLPTLHEYDIVGYDLETIDPNLQDKGPGWPRGDGRVIGIAIATPTGKRYYYPLCPTTPGAERFPPAEETIDHFRRVFTRPDLAIVGANVGYDLGWSRTLGIEFAGAIYDIQVAEALINENKSTYRLEALAQEYFGEGKASNELEEEAERRGSIDKKTGKGDPWPILDQMSVELVGKYAAKDAWLTLKIHQKQIEHFSGKLAECYQLERDILRVVLDMTERGIRIDGERAERNIAIISTQLEDELFNLKALIGRDVDIWSADDIYEVATEHNLPVGTPTRPKDSDVKNGKEYGFDAKFLKANPNPIFNGLLKARQLDRAGNVYLAEKTYSAAVETPTGLRLFPSWRPTRYESKGTKSGRFSSESPNFQQFPSKNGDLAPLIRECFLPEKGEIWLSADFAAQEPRLTAHYGHLVNDPAAKKVVDAYNENPRLDYHQFTADLIKQVANVEVSRTHAKTINLGLSYGMGKKKLANELGLGMKEAEALLSAYHSSVPFVRKLSNMTQRKAEDQGYITTLLGRRRNFNLYGPRQWQPGLRPLPYTAAVEEWGERGITQWFTYKALNALIQGSAADQTKKAMVDCWRAGIKILGTIHDELCFSVSGEEEATEAIRLMETAVELCVPMVVDAEIGERWGNLKEFSLCVI